MKSLTPFILIIAGLGVFFFYVDPLYQDQVKPLKAQIDQYNSVLDSSRELLEKRDALNQKYNAIDPADITKLQKLLPDTIDNVRFVIDLNSIAQRYGMSVSGLNLSGSNVTGSQSQSTISGGPAYQSVSIGFNVTTNYDTFLRFLSDLEQSLRILDVTSISFNSNQSGLYTFAVTIKTYWLK